MTRWGSAGAFTDGTGSVLAREYYEPYGAQTTAGTVGMFQFTGRTVANAGVFYNRARFYDSGTARFLSEDPTGFDQGAANLYEYAASNPISNNDPFGLAVQVSGSFGGSVIGGFFGLSTTATVGINFDGWNTGIYVTGQGAGGGGLGAFAGFGFTANISRGDPPVTGTGSSDYSEIDGGWGPAGQIAFTYDDCGKINGGALGLPIVPKVGGGFGGGFFRGRVKTGTLVLPTVGDVADGISRSGRWVRSWF